MSSKKELLRLARQAKSPDELIAAAEKDGLKLSRENAERCYTALHSSAALSDDELENVSGGCGGDDGPSIPDPLYHGGDEVYLRANYMVYHEVIVLEALEYIIEDWQYRIYDKVTCADDVVWGGCLTRTKD